MGVIPGSKEYMDCAREFMEQSKSNADAQAPAPAPPEPSENDKAVVDAIGKISRKH